MSMILPWLALAGTLLGAEAAPPPKSVLMMPIAPEGGVDPALCTKVTTVLAGVAGRVPGYRVVAYGEIAATMSQEMLKQAAGCNSASCAAEIAGALDTDEVTVGTLGRIGQSYVLTMSRISSRNGEVMARAQRRIEVQHEEEILDGLPGVAADLFGTAATEGESGLTIQAVGVTPEVRRRMVPLRVAAGGALAGALLAGVAALSAAGVAVGVGVHDLALGGRFPRHRISVREALVSDVALLAGGGWAH